MDNFGIGKNNFQLTLQEMSLADRDLTLINKKTPEKISTQLQYQRKQSIKTKKIVLRYQMIEQYARKMTKLVFIKNIIIKKALTFRIKNTCFFRKKQSTKPYVVQAKGIYFWEHGARTTS